MAMKRSSSSIVASMSIFCLASWSTRARHFSSVTPALGDAAVAGVVEVDHLANLGEREADPLAAQDPGEPRAVAPRIDPRQALALAARSAPHPRRSAAPGR